MPSSSALPSLQSLAGLAARVGKCYTGALASKAAFFYPSKVVVVRQTFEAPASASGSKANSAKSQTAAAAMSVPWTIRCVPALLDKARDSAAKRAASSDASASTQAPSDSKDTSNKDSNNGGQNPKDVFSPPYDANLLVSDDQAWHRGYTLLLNKFCVVPKHFLLVTREFQPQTQPPAPEMLALAYKILQAHARLAETSGNEDVVGKGKELLGFYNCGQVSGASQPHQHLQFAEVGNEESDAASSGETDAKTYKYKVPIEALLDRIEHDGKEQETVHALPLPYQHFVVLLGEGRDLVTGDNDGKLSEYMGNKLLGLLDALFQARISASMAATTSADASSSASTAGRKGPPSWNLLLTTRAMHLIPRRKEEFDGLKKDNASSGGEAATENKGEVEEVGSLSVNSLGYAGHMLVKSDRELEALQSYPGGVEAVLASTGVPPVADVTTAAGPGP